ncbi:MAG TPA: helix-turn-helix domain-containing protein [Solirubrobacteraceae bacterium]|nr:helix-turn-helix domain-containing protein [Solirubrobacteraceae bacterium]
MKHSGHDNGASRSVLDGASSPPRRRGRYAEAARNDARLLDAAREIIATRGADAPVAAIAQRAGVGIGSLYRRYGSKTELLQQLCLLAMEQSIAAAEAGMAEPDPWYGLTGYVRACVALRSGALAPLAGRVPTTPEMHEAAARGLALLEQLVARAGLRPDVSPLDVAWLIELFSKTHPHNASAQDELRVHERLLTIALDGLRATPRSALPGPAPTIEQYTGRWT